MGWLPIFGVTAVSAVAGFGAGVEAVGFVAGAGVEVATAAVSVVVGFGAVGRVSLVVVDPGVGVEVGAVDACVVAGCVAGVEGDFDAALVVGSVWMQISFSSTFSHISVRVRVDDLNVDLC